MIGVLEQGTNHLLDFIGSKVGAEGTPSRRPAILDILQSSTEQTLQLLESRPQMDVVHHLTNRICRVLVILRKHNISIDTMRMMIGLKYLCWCSHE